MVAWTLSYTSLGVLGWHRQLTFVFGRLEKLILSIWLALSGAIYSWIAPFFALNRIFFSANENGTVKQNNQSDFKVRLKQSIKFQENERQKVIVWRSLQLVPKLCCFSPKIVWFRNGSNKVAIELRVVQFWFEIILVISNRTHATRSFDFEITRVISDQVAHHSVQLPL